MRTLIDLPEDDMRWLDRKAVEEGKSRAAVVREAVSAFRSEAGKQGIERYFGIWKDRKSVGDGVEFQRRLRAGWSREWDWDHAEVRKEFPDVFEDRDDIGKPTG